MKHYALMKNVINKWQDFAWGKIIVPFADFFKLDCDYCWWWRGVLVGSTLTSLLFIILIGVIL